MCLIVTLVMLGLAIQSFIQHQWMAGIIQLTIALGFMLLLIRNILVAREQKHGCSSTVCGITGCFSNLFKKKEN